MEQKVKELLRKLKYIDMVTGHLYTPNEISDDDITRVYKMRPRYRGVKTTPTKDVIDYIYKAPNNKLVIMEELKLEDLRMVYIERFGDVDRYTYVYSHGSEDDLIHVPDRDVTLCDTILMKAWGRNRPNVLVKDSTVYIDDIYIGQVVGVGGSNIKKLAKLYDDYINVVPYEQSYALSTW